MTNAMNPCRQTQSWLVGLASLRFGKTWSVLLFAILTFSAACAEAAAVNGPAVRPHAEWVNALQPRGTPGPQLTLASSGNTDYVILVPAEPTPQEEKAAADLAAWLHQMTGADFPTLKETGAPPPTKTISIGQTKLLRRTDRSGFLPPEAYAIHVLGDTLLIQGGDTRGIINAVYALLEEDLGCRWYRHDCTWIPHRPNLAFRPVPRTYAPVLEIRDPFYWDAFHVDWSLRNRTNAPKVAVPEEWGGRMHYASGYFVHTYNRLVPPAEYFEGHPEYYSLISGKRVVRQLCITNPDVVRIATEQALEDLRTDPNARLVSISPNDGTGYCECDTCMALDNAEGTRCASLLQFVNAIADAIKDEFPRTKISTLAYLDTIKPPKTIRPRDNVVIRICTDRHAWSHAFEFLTETRECQSALKAWAGIGAKIHIWDYTVNFSHYAIPMPNMPVVSQNIRFLMDHNAKGIMLQGAYQSPGAARGPLRSWVWAKQLWDPSLNTRALMRDFTYGFYGEAAEPMQAYNDLLWQLWEREHVDALRGEAGNIRFAPTSASLSTAFVDEALSLFSEAEALADNPETIRRVKLAKLSILYLKVCQATDRADDAYIALLDELEAICRAEQVTHFNGSVPNFEEKLEEWRDVDFMREPPVPVEALAGRRVIQLPEKWAFKIDPNKAGENEVWYRGPPDASWKPLSIHQVWEDQGYESYDGYAWYTVEIDVPEIAERTLWLLFEAVDETFELWVNGEPAGKSKGDPALLWDRPVGLDVTGKLKPGQKNRITVRVRDAGLAGGIWKPVWVTASDS